MHERISDGQAPNLVRHQVEELRKRLLDLRNSNRLLNFRHSDRARTHVRIVDELPEFLFERFLAGRPLTFRAIPEPAPEANGANEPLTPADEAGKLGIDPHFELPEPSQNGADADKHRDGFVQTLHFPREMERKLDGIRAAARMALEEMGVNTLYSAFGFLEWTEREDTKTTMLSPLVLLPLEIERKLTDGEYRFSVFSNGEDAEINLPLAARLRNDFGLELPELEPDEGPAPYFARVAQLVERMPGWCVRRFVTVGIFQFSRLVMYRDLDPESWKACPLENHRVLKALFEGSEPRDRTATAEDVARLDGSAEAPLLISDADSSQVEAILDVLEGRDLALKGPPGTGKSQTITNLIAAALNRGKNVLFVAEKMAALDVVKERLARAELGEFCLELHSTHAKKKDVLAALGQRLDLQGRYPLPDELVAVRQERQALKARLDRYAQLLNEHFGAMRCTVHEILWREQAARLDAQTSPPALALLTIDKAAGYTEQAFEESQALLARLQTHWQRLTTAANSESVPWGFVTNPSLTVMEAPALLRAMQAWRDQAHAIQGVLEGALVSDVTQNMDLRGLAEFRDQLTALPFHPAIPTSVLTSLKAKESVDSAERYLTLTERVQRLVRSLEQAGVDAERVLQRRGLLERLVSVFGGVSSTRASIEDARQLAETNRKRAAALQQVTARVAPIARHLGLRSADSARCLRALLTAATLVAETPRRVLLARSATLVDERTAHLLAAWRDKAAQLRTHRVRVQEAFSPDAADEPSVLRQHALSLRTARWYSWLFSAFRRARKFYRLYSRGRSATNQTMAAELEDAAAFVVADREFVADKQLAAVCGSLYAGIDTDFDLLVEVSEWGAHVRRKLNILDEHESTLRHALLDRELETLDALGALSADPVCQGAASALSEAPDAASAGLSELTRSLIDRADTLSWVCDAAAELGIDVRKRHDDIARILSYVDDLIRARADAIAVASRLPALQQAHPSFMDELTGLRAAVALARQVHATIPAVADFLLDAAASARCAELRGQIDAALRLGAEERRCAATVVDLAGGAPEWIGFSIAAAARELDACVRLENLLVPWIEYRTVRRSVTPTGLEAIVAAYEHANAPLAELTRGYRWVFYRSLCKEAFAAEPDLQDLSGLGQQQLRERFAALDRELLVLQRRTLKAHLSHATVDPGLAQGPKREWTGAALIRHELAKQTRHLPVRQLMRRAGSAILQLTPCVMMSPHSVSQFLPPGEVEFDLVVMDEASQMRPEDALGAIARARQVVVVGDPEQLPPTSFFGRLQAADEADDDEEPDEKIDSESILNLALSTFVPAKDLRWHYRSRHENLIAFSNREFYDERLIVFPSPQPTNDRFGVLFSRIDGAYEASLNRREAEAIANSAVTFMQSDPDRSLGVVAMNLKQKELIEGLVDALARTEPGVESYRERWEATREGFFVKNLENVQGDERDVIMVSMTYGPDPISGTVLQRFGPINGVFGHRRLNVLFTRAREQIRVFSSMDANDVRADEKSARGVHALADYLRFAATGQLATTHRARTAPESVFEEQVASLLGSHGYEVTYQVGVQGFFIDLGIRHPKYRAGYLCGVECDGASYHSSRVARDRDRLRQQVLEGLGWRLLRIWSTDWFRDPAARGRQLVAEIERLASAGTSAA